MTAVQVQMWEVVAAPGRVGDLLGWVTVTADPAAQIYVSGDRPAEVEAQPGPRAEAQPDPQADARVVVVAADVSMLAEPPAELVTRPPHSWPFRLVRGC